MIRRFALVILIFITMVLLFYSMPGIISIISFTAALLMTLISLVMLRLKPMKNPISSMLVVLVLPFILGLVVVLEGVMNWPSILQVFVAWSFTITFWFNFFMLPLSYHHFMIENSRWTSKSYPPISIIIPAYNEEKVLAKTIEALLEAEYPASKEIIVVDDGSTDRTYEIAKRYFRKGVMVFRKINGGKYSAINFGLLFAKSPIIITVDADTIIGRDALKEIVKPFSDPKVAAVAGNVLVLNKVNFLTRCQALEYVLMINITRRAMDALGTVPVVPGVLGAFRKDVIESVGRYDKDTLTEDFDLTIKCLKTGKTVQASSSALAYTEAPMSLRDFYRQRIRWYRGNIQTVLKHRNLFATRRYGLAYALTYPYLIISLFVNPLLTIPVWIMAFIMMLSGFWRELLLILMLFITLQALFSALAVEFSKEKDKKLVFYSTFFVIGYKHLIDILILKSIIDILTKRKMKWTRSRRYGS